MADSRLDYSCGKCMYPENSAMVHTCTSAQPQSDAPNAAPPYPNSTGIPINAQHWQELFDAGECLNCGKKLGDKVQWNCCWFGTIPEMWWRMTAEAAALRTEQLRSEIGELEDVRDQLTDKWRAAESQLATLRFELDTANNAHRSMAKDLATLRAETIEQCAKIADDISQKYWNKYKGVTRERGTYNPNDEGKSDGAEEVAAVIRAIRKRLAEGE